LDLARRFAHLGCVELLATAMGLEDGFEDVDDDDDERARREWARRHGHHHLASSTAGSGSSTAHVRQEAKARALEKVKETARMLNISKKNFEQLGGDLNGIHLVDDLESKKVESPEEVDAKKANKLVAELEAALEYERVRREKLEAQLDACRDGMEKLNSSKSFASGDPNEDSSDGGDTLRTTTGRSGVNSSAPSTTRSRNHVAMKSPRAKTATRKAKPRRL